MDINNSINKAILVIIGIVVLFSLYGTLIPVAQTSGQALNDSGVPLGQLFLPNGIIFIILMVALLLLVVKSALGGKKK